MTSATGITRSFLSRLCDMSRRLAAVLIAEPSVGGRVAPAALCAGEPEEAEALALNDQLHFSRQVARERPEVVRHSHLDGAADRGDGRQRRVLAVAAEQEDGRSRYGDRETDSDHHGQPQP
jgi:hypothetical protein